ncbi:MAG: hypothetical protein IPN19_03210 [Elusimicrobia bacterium]|nr:hypothetical protein [Elusimicrobiota bacterium]
MKNIKQWAIPKGTTILEARTAAIEYIRSGYRPPYPIKPGQDFGYPGGARRRLLQIPPFSMSPKMENKPEQLIELAGGVCLLAFA